jgi:hypothetical protein
MYFGGLAKLMGAHVWAGQGSISTHDSDEDRSELGYSRSSEVRPAPGHVTPTDRC